MKLKQWIALFLCIILMGSALAGCGSSTEVVFNEENHIQIEDAVTNESADEEKAEASDAQKDDAEAETESSVSISDVVNSDNDNSVNYDTNFVTKAELDKNKVDTNESENTNETVVEDDEDDDIVSSLIDANRGEESEENQDPEGTVEEKDPEENPDKPFDIAYPDLFNSKDIQFADNAILIKMENAYSDATVEGLKSANVGKLEEMFEIGEYTWYTAYLLKGADIEESMEKVRMVPGVQTAEYNYKYETAVSQSAAAAEAEVAQNEHWGKQWPKDHFGIKEGWGKYHDDYKTGGGSKDVIVAVIDTGVDYTHPDLKDNMWINWDEVPDNGVDDDNNGYVDDYYGVDMTQKSGSGIDDNGHGTHVAGIVGAVNNSEGVVGYAYNSKIMAVKAGDASGYFLQNTIAEAIIYAYLEGADVINMSFGGTASSIAVQDALSVAYSRCVLVASAGNEGKINEPISGNSIALPNYPAAFSYVLGVMSVNQQMVESSFTNYDAYGFNSVEYEVYAPGEQIMSTLPGGKYGALSGTSMAAPVVAAQAAMLRSYYSDPATYPTKFIYGQIVGTADASVSCIDSRLHGEHNIPGVVNFYRSMTELPKPDIGMSDYTVFDSVEYIADTDGIAMESAEVNDGDGILDAGEIVSVGFTLRNRWGKADNVKVTIDADSDLGATNPYVTFLNNTLEYDSIGTYSENDCGKLYEGSGESKLWTGWENPFYVKIAKNCPNDYTVKLNLTITYENGLDPKDTTVYTSKAEVVLKIRRGTELPNKITEDMTLTKDNYYIIPNSTIVMEGATLTIEEGTQVQFWCSDPEDAYADSAIAYLKVEGNLICKGTEEEPIEMFPSGWMDQYRVEIYTSADGYAEMEYTNVTNPYLTIDKATNCEFSQVYKNVLYYRELSGSQVVSRYGSAICYIYSAKECTFYKMGPDKYSPQHPAYIAGNYECCIFVDSAINYGDIASAVDCVFYGNNNYWDSEDDGVTSNVTLDNASNNLVVEDVFRNASTGTTYMILNGGVNLDSINRFSNVMGGHLADFNSCEETNYVFERLENVYLYGDDNIYQTGLYLNADNLYNYNGTEAIYDGENIVVYSHQIGKFLIDIDEYFTNGNYGKAVAIGSLRRDKLLFRSIIEIPGTVYITNIVLEDYVVNMDTDSSYVINATLTPSTADVTSLIYSSDNESVAKVDDNGKITPAGEGSTTIKVYSPDYAIYNYITVNVVEAVELEEIKVAEAELVLDIGAEQKVQVKYTPEYTTKREVTYISSDESVVTVNERGVLKAVGEGEAVITVTGYNGLTDTMKVRVVIPVENVAFTSDVYNTTMNKEDGQEFYPIITPSDATVQTLTWESSDATVCYVDDEGKLVKVSDGVAVLKATVDGTALSDIVTVVVSENSSAVGVKKVKYCGDYRYALLEDGSLWRWGGSAQYVIPVQLPFVDVKDFIVNYDYFTILYEDGRLKEYYEDQDTGDYSLQIEHSLSNISSLAESYGFATYAITNDGGVWAWGSNDEGQLGNGSAEYSAIPNPVEFSNDVIIEKVVATPSGAVCLSKAGAAYVVGYGYYLPKLIENGIEDIYTVGNYQIMLVGDSEAHRYSRGESGLEVAGINKKVNEIQIWNVSGQSIYIEEENLFIKKYDGADATCIGSIEGKVIDKLFVANENFYLTYTDGSMYAYGPGSGYVLGNGADFDSLDKVVRVYFIPAMNKDFELESWSGICVEEDDSYVVSDRKITLDFNQAIAIGNTYSGIQLTDVDGMAIMSSKQLDLDKLSIEPRTSLEVGETYTLIIPQGALRTENGNETNEALEWTFVYDGPMDSGTDTEIDTDTSVGDDSEVEKEPEIHDAVVDDEKISNRHMWTSEEVLNLWKQFVSDGYNTRFYSNVILNRLSNDDTNTWLRFVASQAETGTTIGLGGNYWGTTDSFLINKQILDFDDYQNLADINEGVILTTPPEDTFPFVVNAYLEVDGEVVEEVGNDLVTFVVEFNRDMDTDFDLNVCFGSAYPHRDYTVEGEYESARVWKGQVQLTTLIESGYQYWSVSNGKAAGTSLKLYEDWGRFPFKIDTSSAQALIMQAEVTESGILLTWEQDDFTTLAGYNVYRSTKEDGQYVKINTTVIPADTKEWFDDGVEPGQTYYYNFTVVESDMNESEPSGKVQATAMDTMAPNIYHSPVYQAFAGNKLVVSATVTDNVGIQSATLYYRVVGSEEWKTSEMTNSNDKYSGIIPAEFVTIAGVEYYIEATDGIAQTYKGSESVPYVITVQEPVDESQKGDVDGNGVIELKDALMVLMAINDRLNLNQTEFTRADLDGDGELAAYEALRIIQYVNGTITSVLP